MTVIRTEARFTQDQQTVFDFVTTPANWPRWHPSSVSVTGPGADHSAVIGEEVTEEFQVAGRKGSVVWKVIERDAPQLWVIEGTIVGRRNGGQIRYELTPDGAGTRFTRVFTYPTPGFIFAAADRLIFRRRVESESNEALQRLAGVLAGL